MIIYVEGISCAGKSTFIKAITDSGNNINKINEWPDIVDNSISIDEFCRRNDEQKNKTAQELGKNEIVLVDRSYASTLAYNFIQFEHRKSQEYLKSLSWFLKSKTKGSLVSPDLYIIISVDGKTSIKRAKELERYNKNIAWYINPELGSWYYRHFIKLFEPNIPVLELDGTKPLQENIDAFWKFVDKYK